MWQSLKEIGSVTNTVTLPHAGLVGINKPDDVHLMAYINNVPTPLHHLHVQEGDTLYFKLEGNKSSVPTTIDIAYDGGVHKLDVAAIPPVAPYSIPARSEQILPKEMEYKMMKEDINIFGSGSGSGGAMGAGLGAGVLGGVLGGVLLNNRNGLLNNGSDGGFCYASNVGDFFGHCYRVLE